MRKKLSISLVVVFLSVVMSFALTSRIYSSAFSMASFSDFDVTSSSLSREYEVLLKSRCFIPSPGISRITRVKIESTFFERVHVLIQFKHIPSSVERETLTDNGVRLLAYIPNKAWFASISTVNLAYIAKLSFVRSIEVILPEDKISPQIRGSGVGPWVTNNDGTVSLVVVFFGDVSERDAQRILRRYGTDFSGPGMLNDYTVTAFESVIQSLADEDAVQWIEEVPPLLEDHNNGLRAKIDANTVQAAPYNLDGSGVTIGQWESWNPDSSHWDLQGRVTVVENRGTGEHATRVAGVFGGDGTRSIYEHYQPLQFRGVAPNVEWVSYSVYSYDQVSGDWVSDVAGAIEEHYEAINTYGIDISQNSWGLPTGRGDYTTASGKYDNITIGAYGKRIIIVFSAGNEGDERHYFNTTMPPGGTAKNTIVVANIDSDSDRLPVPAPSGYGATSWGPTDDGRLKPDLVAPGGENWPFYTSDKYNENESIYTTQPGNTYQGGCGTSYSAPAVSGSIALMLQAYRITHSNVDPLPSTIKAILVQTARDVNATGPDYRTGYGVINVTTAVDLIRSDNMINDVIVEEAISQEGETDYYSILVPGGQPELKVTLVWDDYPGTANAAKELVNDLDLVLIAPNGAVYHPWILNRYSPSNLATTGEDHTNNVEQVEITDPAAGKWIVRINGTDVPYPDQRYSLVCNNLDWNIENVDSGGLYRASIALDSSGNPHIAYATGARGFIYSDLKYAYYDGTAWNVETVHKGVLTQIVGEGATIAIDSADNPHIAYLMRLDALSGGDVFYAYRDPSLGWQIKDLTVGMEIRGEASLVLDSLDNPHISFEGSYLYRNASGYWSLGPGGASGPRNSLALDSSDDSAHVASFNLVSDTLMYANSTRALKFAVWNFSAVDQTGIGGPNSIALDSFGKTYIAYYDETNKDLKYAYYDGSVWNTVMIESTGDVGDSPSLALDAFDHPRISYLNRTYEYVTDLKYAYHDGLMWNNKIVCSNCTEDLVWQVGEGYSLALDALGIPHISYASYNYTSATWNLTYVRGGGLSKLVPGGVRAFSFETGTFGGWDFSSSTNGTQNGTIYYYDDPAAVWNSSIVSGANALSGSYSARLLADFWQHTGTVGPWRADAAINRTLNRAGASILRATLKFNDIQGSGGVGLSYFGIFVYNALNTSKRVFYGFTTTGDYGDIRYTVSPGELVNFERNIVTDYFNKYGENLPDQIMICLLSSADYAEGTGERRTTDVIVDDILIVALRDMATTSVTPSKTVVGQGYLTSINITVENRGDFSETFSVTAYANTTAFQSKAITLTSGNSITVTVTWNTTGWAKGNYTISAYAWPLPGETNTTDNNKTDGSIVVAHPGDVNNDCVVDIADVVLVTAIYRSKCGEPDYSPNSDIIEDCVIDIADVVAVTAHYREVC